MRSRCNRSSWHAGVLSLALAWTIGCGDVREDRTIAWSGDGKNVGFQHGRAGVFIANSQTGARTKIYTPSEDVLATSSPLWSADGRECVFTTAVADDDQPDPGRAGIPLQPPADPDDWDDTPDGRLFGPRPVRYTCWLHRDTDSDADSDPAEPLALFTARCDHVGYVAANLAVRWHPTERRLLFVERVGEMQHAVFEYDLEAGERRRLLSAAADAVICEWAPDGRHIACATGRVADGVTRYELTIAEREDDAPWQIAVDSEPLEIRARPSLERLRSLLPIWTRDSERFACAAAARHGSSQTVERWRLLHGDLSARTLDVLANPAEPLSDVDWSPDGRRIGYIRQTNPPRLQVIEVLPPSGPRTIGDQPVRDFAGWDGSGASLAYTVAAASTAQHTDSWARLLEPQPAARDAVLVADGDGRKTPRAVFAGMRVTFPRWSPREKRLSFWATFSPTHRSVTSWILDSGLRPGDPAVILDVDSGRIEWLPVTAAESAQVGHYYLMKQDAAEPLRWYERAETSELEAGPSDERRGPDWLADRDNFQLFHAWCLSRLGRDVESARKVAQFREHSSPQRLMMRGDAALDRRTARVASMVPADREFLLETHRALYIAEVFLSLDASGEGMRFLQRWGNDSSTETERLAADITQGQLLLLDGWHREYIELATSRVAPGLARWWNDRDRAAAEAPAEQHWGREALFQISGLALEPMSSPSFLMELDAVEIETMLEQWCQLEQVAVSDIARNLATRVMRAAHERLGTTHTATRNIQDVRSQAAPGSEIRRFAGD